MKRQTAMHLFLAGTLLLSTSSVLAADQNPPQEQLREQERRQEQIYGHQLMTEQERAEQRARMRAEHSAEKQAQVRKVHHEQMTERANARGLSLPDRPSSRGGMGPGGGAGGMRGGKGGNR